MPKETIKTTTLFRVEHQQQGDKNGAWWHSPGRDEVNTLPKARKLVKQLKRGMRGMHIVGVRILQIELTEVVVEVADV